MNTITDPPCVEFITPMLTIILPLELESTIAERARQSGVTPEALKLQGLREQFLAEASEPIATAENVQNSARSAGADFLLSMAAMFESETMDTSQDHQAVVAAAIGRKHRR